MSALEMARVQQSHGVFTGKQEFSGDGRNGYGALNAAHTAVAVATHAGGISPAYD